jgi:hypothetical protein
MDTPLFSGHLGAFDARFLKIGQPETRIACGDHVC